MTRTQDLLPCCLHSSTPAYGHGALVSNVGEKLVGTTGDDTKQQSLREDRSGFISFGTSSIHLLSSTCLLPLPIILFAR